MTDTEYAVQNGGKAHRPDSSGTVTACGVRIPNTWRRFPVAEALTEDKCHRCYPPTPTDELIEAEVARAARAYAWGCPGHGRYVLTRLAMRLDPGMVVRNPPRMTH